MQQENVKDVSDLPEVPQNNDIPIYGHSDQEDKSNSAPKTRKKRIFDHEANSSEITSNSQDIKQSDNKGNVSSSNEDNDNDSSNAEGSISEAGEVANVEYVVPPLSLLNQPAKQQSTSKAEVQRKGQVLESTMKNFGVNAKVTQIKIGPAVTQYEVQPAQGVKVSKIVNLHNDIALALAAKDVRIEALFLDVQQ